MTDLSPAAQAVLDAAADVYWDWADMSPASSYTIAAAALRVAADEAARADPLGDTVEDCIRGAEREHMRGKICAIANELEGQP